MCDPRYICPEGIQCFIFCTASDKNILVIFFTASAPHHPVNILFPERQCFMQSGNRRIENIPKISMCVLPTGKAALPPRSFASPTSWPGIRATASNPKPAFQPLVHQCSASILKPYPQPCILLWIICIFHSPFISTAQSKEKKQANIWGWSSSSMSTFPAMRGYGLSSVISSNTCILVSLRR